MLYIVDYTSTVKVNHSIACVKIHTVGHNKITYFETLQDATDFCQLPCIYSLKDSILGRLHFQKILMCIKIIIYLLSFFTVLN